MQGSNVLGFVVGMLGMITTVKGVDHIAYFIKLDSKLSRKIIHIVTGPIYASTWLLYEDGWVARLLCGFVPFISTVYFVLVGLGYIQDKKLIMGATRGGARSELLAGPLMYGTAICLCCVIFWRYQLEGILAICVLCGGDGIADVIGRKFGYLLGPLPWNQYKTYMGSIGCFAGGFIFSLLGTLMFWSTGFIVIEAGVLVYRCLIAAFVGAAAESLPHVEDNLTVPLAVVISQKILF
eukprot:TRINITY_DN3999_c1_g1_i3.p2 TRINITY_DN3999_c1_g1~~TRINITY_DN3999_c1_g1_i3.p2  ORF type:complete len:237 (-),score=40.51 TRINITY_DN3999_c1_g1_i3:492-1202(-)